jgi:hypothetical protein
MGTARREITPLQKADRLPETSRRTSGDRWQLHITSSCDRLWLADTRPIGGATLGTWRRAGTNLPVHVGCHAASRSLTSNHGGLATELVNPHTHESLSAPARRRPTAASLLRRSTRAAERFRPSLPRRAPTRCSGFESSQSPPVASPHRKERSGAAINDFSLVLRDAACSNRSNTASKTFKMKCASTMKRFVRTPLDDMHRGLSDGGRPATCLSTGGDRQAPSDGRF